MTKITNLEGGTRFGTLSEFRSDLRQIRPKLFPSRPTPRLRPTEGDLILAKSFPWRIPLAVQSET